MKMTHDQRLQRAHIQVVRSKEFALASGILMMGNGHEVKVCGTACTDGLNKYYDPDFMDKLEEKELIFVVLHENFHILLKQITTWEKLHKINPQIANMALDYVINGMIDNLDPDGKVMNIPRESIIKVCLDHKYDGWDAGQVFKDLMKQAKQQPQGGEGEGSGGQGGLNRPGDGEPLDTHDWEKAKEMTAQEVKDLEDAIDMAVRSGGLLAGKVGGKDGRDIGAIEDPKIDWRKALKSFITDTCAGKDISTWHRPNRRFIGQQYPDGQPMYMPTTYSEAVGELVIGVDTSGSIGDEELREFLSEVKGICELVKPAKVTLLYWDTEVAGIEEYDESNYASLIDSTKPAGGGGTDPHCVSYYVTQMKKQPVAVIMLTDGYVGSFSTFAMPVLWAITTNVIASNGITLPLN